MPELLIHFIIPFFLLSLYGYSIQKAAIFSSFAIIPDFDVFFHYHPAPLHSFVVLLSISVILLTSTYAYFRNDRWCCYIVLISAILLSHPFLDMFNSYIPVLYPLWHCSINIDCDLLVNINNLRDFSFNFAINKLAYTAPSPITTDFYAGIFTSSGVVVSLLLLAGIALIKRNEKNNYSDSNTQRREND